MAALTLLNGAIDGLIALALLWVAGRALASTDLFRAVVLFIGFGLVLALAWVRLGAPDIALAEAAIGAGLTGALLLVALARLERADREAAAGREGSSANESERPQSRTENRVSETHD